MSIQEGWGRIKSLTARGEAILAPLIVILVGTASFGLGRLSVQQEAEKPIVIATYELSAERPGMRAGGLLVGSRTGKSYHFPWCPGATSIKDSNRVWFTDEADARAKGYRPAGNCDGLVPSAETVKQ